MGIYLTKPSTDINCEIGGGYGVEFAVGEMQGWRKHMEDSHIAMPGIAQNEVPVSLFGVFDGHGGKEVAKFVKLKYPDLLLKLESFQKGDYIQALKESFHGIDQLLEDEEHDRLLKELRALPNPSDGPLAHRNVPSPFIQQSTVQKASDDSNVGTRSKTEARSPSPDSRDDGDLESPNSPTSSDSSKEDEALSSDEAIRMIQELLEGARKLRNQQKKGKSEDKEEVSPKSNTPGTTPSSFLEDDDSSEESDGEKDISLVQPFNALSMRRKDNLSQQSFSGPSTEEQEKLTKNSSENVDRKVDSAAAEAKTTKEVNVEETKVAEVKNDSQVVVYVSNENNEETTEKEKDDSEQKAVVSTPPPPPAPASIMSAKGTLICNLRDHRVLAGCTAVVALLVGKKLLVANAGDSRAVMMRNGVGVALSEDHKPTQERELNRIQAAGGYVNMVGRVNGNLNLSRSLGDLKYKQLKHLEPEAQIITAEPDITIFDVEDTDEFFILACDGIWDCLTNQQACDLVKDGLNQGLSLEEITKKVLKTCLADDPRSSQGIGGDNMTFLVVLLKPQLKGSTPLPTSESPVKSSKAEDEPDSK